jgi:dienelactone hydrolase
MRGSAAGRIVGVLLTAALSACAVPPRGVPEPGPPLPAIPHLTVTESASARAVLDVGAVPGLTEAGRRSYARFLTYPAPRAFAIGAEGGLAWAANARDTEEAERRALAQCRNANGGRPCRVYARDQQVVWHGNPVTEEPSPVSVAGEGWVLASPPGFLRHGRAAAGALLWTHGRGSTPRHQQAADRAPTPLPFVQRFNNAGWDVWVLIRDPAYDVNYDSVLSFADASLRVAALALRHAGYRRVVAAGQSAGGWAALAALDTPGLLDGAIAIAGAGLYQPPPGQVGTLDFAALIDRVRDPQAAIVVAMFEGDHLLPWPERSAALLREALRDRPGPVLVIERPAGLLGHGAGAEPAFNDRYGDCILRVVSLRDGRGC